MTPRDQHHDFGDGFGPVPAHQHRNGDGWVSDKATVAATAFVGPSATVRDWGVVAAYAQIKDFAIVSGYLRFVITLMLSAIVTSPEGEQSEQTLVYMAPCRRSIAGRH